MIQIIMNVLIHVKEELNLFKMEFQQKHKNVLVHAMKMMMINIITILIPIFVFQIAVMIQALIYITKKVKKFVTHLVYQFLVANIFMNSIIIYAKIQKKNAIFILLKMMV